MRILVCDDDQDYAELIVSDLNKFFDNKFFDININIINNNFDLYLKEKCDICFMDIDLKNQSGISIVKNLKKNNKNMIIIFVSAREDLVFDTFSVEPFQFIRKNHYIMDMKDALEQLAWKLKNQYIRILIRENKRYVNIKIFDIDSVISIEHDLIINTKKETYHTTGTLKNFYEKNKDTSLIQIQKNMIINMEKIESAYKNNIVYENGKEYEIGRVYRKNFDKRYEEYLYL